jgi:hypothetical protein
MNSTLLHATTLEIEKFEHTPKFQWIKGHANTILNERADILAKEARELNTNPERIKFEQPTTRLHFNDSPIYEYPSKTLKKLFQELQQQSTELMITRRWDIRNIEIDTKLFMYILVYRG